jgi:hypothetical protein
MSDFDRIKGVFPLSSCSPFCHNEGPITIRLRGCQDSHSIGFQGRRRPSTAPAMPFQLRSKFPDLKNIMFRQSYFFPLCLCATGTSGLALVPPGSFSLFPQSYGPNGSIVCMNKYATVMPYQFSRQPWPMGHMRILIYLGINKCPQ